jgi:16S rRNA (cytosine1402-N4)-methyltransferase
VLFAEVMAALRPASGGAYLDGTLGAGGHAAGLLDAAAPDGRLLGLDRDPSAVAFAANRLAPFGQRATLVVSSFGDMADVAPAHGFDAVDGVLLDLGLSSRQLATPRAASRSLTTARSTCGSTPVAGRQAADLINNLSAEELTDIFFRYGEEQQSRRIARLIVAHRPMQTTAELATLIEREARRSGRPGRHPATKGVPSAAHRRQRRVG